MPDAKLCKHFSQLKEHRFWRYKSLDGEWSDGPKPAENTHIVLSGPPIPVLFKGKRPIVHNGGPKPPSSANGWIEISFDEAVPIIQRALALCNEVK